MSKKFVEIEDSVYENLQKVAKDNGLDTVEKLLTKVALEFSNGCSVTVSSNGSKAA